MTSINPFSGYIAQAASAERAAASDKSRQVRRSVQLSKTLAARDDEMEHQVESSDEVAAIHDENASHQEQPRQQKGKQDEEEPPHVDLKA